MNVRWIQAWCVTVPLAVCGCVADLHTDSMESADGTVTPDRGTGVPALVRFDARSILTDEDGRDRRDPGWYVYKTILAAPDKRVAMQALHSCFRDNAARGYTPCAILDALGMISTYEPALVTQEWVEAVAELYLDVNRPLSETWLRDENTKLPLAVDTPLHCRIRVVLPGDPTYDLGRRWQIASFKVIRDGETVVDLPRFDMPVSLAHFLLDFMPWTDGRHVEEVEVVLAHGEHRAIKKVRRTFNIVSRREDLEQDL